MPRKSSLGTKRSKSAQRDRLPYMACPQQHPNVLPSMAIKHWYQNVHNNEMCERKSRSERPDPPHAPMFPGTGSRPSTQGVTSDTLKLLRLRKKTPVSLPLRHLGPLKERKNILISALWTCDVNSLSAVVAWSKSALAVGFFPKPFAKRKLVTISDLQCWCVPICMGGWERLWGWGWISSSRFQLSAYFEHVYRALPLDWNPFTYEGFS